MQNKRIIYTNADGGVSVVIPAPGVTYEQLVKAVSEGVPFELVDVTEVPSDRTFRNAWEKNGKGIVHNLDKAKDSAHAKRRAKRAAEFAPLDVESTIPAKAQAAEAARQAIRDRYTVIQENIDAAATIEDLKAIVVNEGL